MFSDFQSVLPRRLLLARSLLLAATCLVSIASGSSSGDRDGSSTVLNCLRAVFTAALIALGQQTQSSIIFPSSMPDDQDAPEVVGNFSILQILDQLIENRDIEYRIVGPHDSGGFARCQAGWDCAAMHEDLQRSKQQYPMIEELIVRGKPLTGSRFKQIDGNSFTPTDIITATEIRLSGAQTLSQLMRFTPEVAGNSASTAVSNGGNGTASVTLRGLPAYQYPGVDQWLAQCSQCH